MVQGMVQGVGLGIGQGVSSNSLHHCNIDLSHIRCVKLVMSEASDFNFKAQHPQWPLPMNLLHAPCHPWISRVVPRVVPMVVLRVAPRVVTAYEVVVQIRPLIVQCTS